MRTKIFLLIVIVSCLFYNCVEEEREIESINTSVLKRSDTISTNDSISNSEPQENEADPPKDKDPYIKRTEVVGE